MQKVQTVVCSKERFPTEARARQWLTKHGFESVERVVENATQFRFLVTPERPRSAFASRLADGVTAVVGNFRPRTVRDITDDEEQVRRLSQLDAAFELGAFSQLEAVSYELRRNSQAMADETRLGLLRELRGGEVVELDVDVLAFQQPKNKPRPLPVAQRKLANRNFVTFRESDLPRLASSFVGRPFLRDHDRRDLLKRGGTITRSELQETSNQLRIMQTVRLVAPWAVEAALMGTLSSFSVGWDPSESGLTALVDSVFCTVDGKRMFGLECRHVPGETTKVAKSEEPAIVEAEFRKPVGAEVSGVGFPAVAGTSVEAIRQPAKG